MKAAIVILNFNGEKLLKQFLPAVIRFTPDYAEIIVADNASTDGSLQVIREHFPTIKTIELPSNTGFAGGYNNALKSVVADYYVLLNSDIEVTPSWIQPIIEFMDVHPNVAACQPKVLSFLNKNLFEYAGASGGFIDYLGYPFCRGRIFDKLEKDNHQYNDATEIFWASGACMFIRSTVFHSMNGFDETFFAHMEEIDLCWRLKSAGHKVYCIPESLVYHVGGGTLPKGNPKKTYLNFRNNLMMLYKNLNEKHFYPVLQFRTLLDLLAAFSFLLSGQWKDMQAVWKAYRYIRKNKTDILKKRNLQAHSESALSCMYSKSILTKFYLQQKNKFTQLDKKDFTE